MNTIGSIKIAPAPKDPLANSRYRRGIFARAAADDDFKHECWIRSARDPIYFCDVFGWTFSPKDYPDTPERPFILYPYQETALLKIDAAITKGEDRLIEKSRDMGASWLLLLILLHRWQFRRRQTFLIVSRKKDLVDRAGDPDSLFWKLMFLLEHLPGWLAPHFDKTDMKLVNEDNGSTINGESANEDLSRGGRRTAIMLDEFAAIDNGYSVLSASRGATNCRLFNSTPRGSSGAYYDRRQSMSKDSPEGVLRLHWSEHPERRVGLYTTVDNVDGGQLKVLDAGYLFPQDYPFVLDGKLRSPYYDSECYRAANAQEIAVELDIDYAASGWPVFDRKKLDVLLAKATDPLLRGEIVDDGGAVSLFCEKGGRLKLWLELDKDGKVPPGTYVIACDIATGKGGDMSSNSVASVCERKTDRKVAEFASNQIDPAEFARYVVAMCKLFHEAFLIWEENGPGNIFTITVRDAKYRHVFYREVDEIGFGRKKTRKPGFYTTKESKRVLLSGYWQALMEGAFFNPCREALEECGEYVHKPNGEYVHVKAESGIDPTATGEEHGDRVIADALCHRAFYDISVAEESKVEIIPPNSFAGRQAAARKKALEKASY